MNVHYVMLTILATFFAYYATVLICDRERTRNYALAYLIAAMTFATGILWQWNI